MTRWLAGRRDPGSTRPAGYMSRAELETRYPGEWVLLDQPTTDRSGQVTGGVLRLHTKDLDGFNAQVVAHRTPHMAALYLSSDADRNPDQIDVISVWTDASTPP